MLYCDLDPLPILVLIDHIMIIILWKEERIQEYLVSECLSPLLPPWPGAGPTVPAKVQQLAESLQQISGQLNMVLGALGSLAPHSSVSAGTQGPAAPLSAGPSWAWGGRTHSRASPGATPLFATPVAGAQRAPADLLSSRWAQLFSGRLRPLTVAPVVWGSAAWLVLHTA